MQAPPTQRWPVPHATPAPHAQAPVAEQLSLDCGSQVRHAAPALPQAPAVGTVHTPAAQQPSGQVVALHAPAASRRQLAEQPSFETVLPSSHSSIPARTTLSPQMAGAPSVRIASTSWPARTATAC